MQPVFKAGTSGNSAVVFKAVAPVIQPKPKPSPAPVVNVNRLLKEISVAPSYAIDYRHSYSIWDYIPIIVIPPKRTFYYTPVAPIVTVTSTKSRSSRAGDVTTLLDKFKEVNKKFSSYENLTGISSQRPELLMMSEFKPIFNEDFRKQSVASHEGQDFVQGLNDYGDFIDIQLQMQNLYHYNISKLIKDIKDADPERKIDIEKREARFLEAMAETIKNVNYLYGLSRQVENCKDSFNVKSDKFVISWETMVRNYYYDYYSWFLRYFGVSRNYVSQTPSKFLTRFGYQNQGTANFSSTKLYLQLLAEFKNITSNFSAKMLNQSTDRQKNDFKAVTINTNVYNAFYDVSRVATDIESPLYSDIARLNGKSIGAAVPRLSSFFNQIDKSFSFPKAEDKITFYSHFLSREFRYSAALSNAETQTFLAQNYGYQVNNQGSNFNLIDFMIGRVGTKITDTFTNTNPNSLVAPSHITVGDNLVLPFESKYLELDGSIFTPGSEYLIDSIFENAGTPSPDGSPLNVSNLEKYTNATNQVSNRFTEFVDRMRFFYMVPSDGYSYWYRLSFNDRSTIESPQRFVEVIYDSIMDSRQTARFDIANDPMSALINLAYKDNTLKALLYMYVIISNSGNPAQASYSVSDVRSQLGLNSYDDLIIQNEQSALDRLIEEILGRVNALVATRFNYLYNDIFNIFGFYATKFRPYLFDDFEFTGRGGGSPGGGSFDEVTSETIANGLRQGSPALNFLKNSISRILNGFRNNGAFNGTKTRYSDINDSLVTAMAFELCLTTFDNHINTRFLNRFFTQGYFSVGREYYTISSKQTNTGASVSLVQTKISDEVDLQIQCITGLTAILRRVVDNCLSILNAVRGEETVRVLNSVIATLGSRKYLTHLMSEQQLILAKSLTDDVRTKLFANGSVGEIEASSERAVKKSNDLSVLDDITISGNMRNAFFSFFAQDSLSTKKAFNARILTVGVPNAFTQNIREKISIDLLDKNYNKKQVDVINLCVYKMDVEFQDIIFKPQKFAFELSRFVQKNELDIKPLGIDSSIDQIVRAVPTRDYSIEIENAKDVVSTTAPFEQTDLFTNPEYSFLSNQQKFDLAKNHIASHFLGMYLKLLTGVNANEYSFELLLNEDDRIGDKKTIEAEFLKTLVTSRISTRLARPVLWEDIISFGSNAAYSAKQERTIYRDVRVISDLARVSSAVSDPAYEARRLLRPKEFERIFHVAVDPDDYEIDISATQRTAQGRESLQKLLKKGIVVPIDEFDVTTGDRVVQNARLRLVERSPAENNLVFEKYFVNFETVLPTTIDQSDPRILRRER